jgi:hypothetical protein
MIPFTFVNLSSNYQSFEQIDGLKNIGPKMTTIGYTITDSLSTVRTPEECGFFSDNDVPFLDSSTPDLVLVSLG